MIIHSTKRNQCWSFWCHGWSDHQNQEGFLENLADEAVEASEVPEALRSIRLGRFFTYLECFLMLLKPTVIMILNLSFVQCFGNKMNQWKQSLNLFFLNTKDSNDAITQNRSYLLLRSSLSNIGSSHWGINWNSDWNLKTPTFCPLNLSENVTKVSMVSDHKKKTCSFFIYISQSHSVTKLKVNFYRGGGSHYKRYTSHAALNSSIE